MSNSTSDSPRSQRVAYRNPSFPGLVAPTRSITCSGPRSHGSRVPQRRAERQISQRAEQTAGHAGMLVSRVSFFSFPAREHHGCKVAGQGADRRPQMGHTPTRDNARTRPTSNCVMRHDKGRTTRTGFMPTLAGAGETSPPRGCCLFWKGADCHELHGRRRLVHEDRDGSGVLAEPGEERTPA